jgi:hypothetical protein
MEIESMDPESKESLSAAGGGGEKTTGGGADTVATPSGARDLARLRWATYVGYLQMKVEENDWHGVADAAADLRELEARHPELREGR